MPCLHCQLIEMGEMACYQEFCPHCGRVPPSRKTREDQLLEAQGYHRRLVVLDGLKRGEKPPQNPDRIEVMAEKDLAKSHV